MNSMLKAATTTLLLLIGSAINFPAFWLLIVVLFLGAGSGWYGFIVFGPIRQRVDEKTMHWTLMVLAFSIALISCVSLVFIYGSPVIFYSLFFPGIFLILLGNGFMRSRSNYLRQ